MLLVACGLRMGPGGIARGAERICPRLEVEHPIRPGLSDEEKRLVCGDRINLGAANEGWRRVPLAQARTHLTAFLQDRAYLHPRIQVEDKLLRIDPGPKTRVTRLSARGAPDTLHLERKRDVIGQDLTPALLGTVENWVTQQLQNVGYACPEVKALADANTGEIVVQVKTGPLESLVKIDEESIPGLEPGVLRRYDAFTLGRRFDQRLLTLTSERAVSEGVVEDTHFNVECVGDGVHARQISVVGAPRLLSAGFGVDTEQIFLTWLSWQNSRLGKRASFVSLTASASAKLQEIDGSISWYYSDDPTSRRTLRPLIQLKHDNESSYETESALVQVEHGVGYELRGARLNWRIGPGFEAFRTLQGVGPRDTHFLSLFTDAHLLGHGFEYFRGSPRSGLDFQVSAGLSARTLLSSVSAQRFGLRAEYLWNYDDYDPPLYVIGLRGGLNTTVSGERPGPDVGLPVEFLQYLGGASDLRGFGRQELPTSGQGGLSSAFASIEFRADVLPYGLEPFVFTDAGGTGTGPWKLNSPLYLSPGIGMRWQSPIGVVRATAAHGYLAGSSNELASASHFQFYFSFGEEF